MGCLTIEGGGGGGGEEEGEEKNWKKGRRRKKKKLLSLKLNLALSVTIPPLLHIHWPVIQRIKHGPISRNSTEKRCHSSASLRHLTGT